MQKNKIFGIAGIFLFLMLCVSLVSAIPRPEKLDISEENIAIMQKQRAFNSFLSIFTSEEKIYLGDSVSYNIQLATSMPDDDYSDGTYQQQFGGWVFINDDGDIFEEHEFERVYGLFEDEGEITPTEGGKYALVALIIQYDQTYNQATGEWETEPEETLIRESNRLDVTDLDAPPTPSIGIFSYIGKLLAGFWSWFIGLFT